MRRYGKKTPSNFVKFETKYTRLEKIKKKFVNQWLIIYYMKSNPINQQLNDSKYLRASWSYKKGLSN